MDPNVYDWGHGPRLTALGQSRLASQLSQVEKGEKAPKPKEQWKKCSYCGIITDIDEEYCPQRGLRNNQKHELQIVELEEEEVKKLYKEGKVWTKHVADFKRRLSQ